jgi:dTDP-4-amino-4,6-dideoxygalactose transaminase
MTRPPSTTRSDDRPSAANADAALPFLAFHRPSIGEREKSAVLEVMDSGWLTVGPRTKAFEAAFAEYVGARHAIALNSATAALHLAMDAFGVGAGDEVIVPTWTFAASAEVAVYEGARPVLVDIDPVTLNARVEDLLAAITPRTKAIVAVHLAGRPMAIEELVREADTRGIKVVEDAAHSFPSRIGGPGGPMAGTVGHVGAYSFYATKTISTGEGGMLVTDDDTIADRARLMSLHGISRSAWNRYAAAGSWSYEIEDAGFKYNMTDLAAAIGLVQLSRAEELLGARQGLAAAYREAFAASSIADLVELPTDADDGSHAWHLFILRLRPDRLTIDRGAVIERLKELGIGTSVHFIPLHLHPYYQGTWGYAPTDLPTATREFGRVISLPLWPGMTGADTERVVDAFDRILGSARR